MNRYIHIRSNRRGHLTMTPTPASTPTMGRMVVVALICMAFSSSSSSSSSSSNGPMFLVAAMKRAEVSALHQQQQHQNKNGTSELAPRQPTTQHRDHLYNVFGNTLKPCSTQGMAVTGVTGSGYCDHYNTEDKDHHHHKNDDYAHTVCIDLESFGGRAFFDLTGQPDWTDYEAHRALPCVQPRPQHWNNGGTTTATASSNIPSSPSDGNSTSTATTATKLLRSSSSSSSRSSKNEDATTTTTSSNSCPIVHWCVSQQDFATYLQVVGRAAIEVDEDDEDDDGEATHIAAATGSGSGSCSSLGHIVCESTNAKLVADYELAIMAEVTTTTDPATQIAAQAALDCIKEKCWF